MDVLTQDVIKIEIGDVAADGDIGTSLRTIGYTGYDSFMISMHQEQLTGKFIITDPDMSVLVEILGGEVKNGVYQSPISYVTQYKSLVITPDTGLKFSVVNATVSGMFVNDFSEKEWPGLQVTWTALQPQKEDVMPYSIEKTGSMADVYRFSAFPSALSALSTGETFQIQVTSTKNEQVIAYTIEAPSYVTITNETANGFNAVFSNNPETSARQGCIVLRQTDTMEPDITIETDQAADCGAIEGKYVALTFDRDMENESVEVTIAPLKYDKHFAITCRHDDGSYSDMLDALSQFLPDTFGAQGQESDGMFYTDGCGTRIPFSISLALINNWLSSLENDGYIATSSIKKYSGVGIGCMFHESGKIGRHDVNDLDIIRQDIAVATDDYIDRLGYRPRVATLSYGKDGWVNIAGCCPISEYGYKLYDDYIANPTVAGIKLPSPDATGLKVAGITKAYFTEYPIIATLLAYAGNTTLSEMKTMIDGLASNPDSYHRSIFSHGFRVSEGDATSNLGDIFRYIHDRYGEAGTDSVWVADAEEFINYMYSKTFSELELIKQGNMVYIKVDGQREDWVTKAALTLKVASSAVITNVSINDLASQTNNLHHKNSGIINIEFDEDFIHKATTAIELTEELPVARNKALAQILVSRVTDQTIKDNLQARIDAITVDDGKRIYIHFGSTPGNADYGDLGWNLITDHTAGVKLNGLKYSKSDQGIAPATLTITKAFAGAVTGQVISTGSMFTRYPRNAMRQCFTCNASNGEAAFVISGLPAGDYRFLLGGAGGTTAKGKTATFSVTANGATSETKSLNCYGNINDVVEFSVDQLATDVEISMGYLGVDGFLGVMEIIQTANSVVFKAAL